MGGASGKAHVYLGDCMESLLYVLILEGFWDDADLVGFGKSDWGFHMSHGTLLLAQHVLSL